ncbi:MAG TPA: hypothetical protein VLF91_05305 [Candidatus Saccharimonadales bacterium]|nr:hypothetical protein [Candidatus Saccharimonadales bacterium]
MFETPDNQRPFFQPFFGSFTAIAGTEPDQIEIRVAGRVPNDWQHLVLLTQLPGVTGVQSVVWDRDLHDMDDAESGWRPDGNGGTETVMAIGTVTISDPAQRETLIAALQSVLMSVMLKSGDVCIGADLPQVDDLDSLRERLLSVDGVSHVLAVNLEHDDVAFTRVAALYKDDENIDPLVEGVIMDFADPTGELRAAAAAEAAYEAERQRIQQQVEDDIRGFFGGDMPPGLKIVVV